MPAKLPMRETVGMALATLRANRLRSLLTMLGIVIGNASVITLVGVGRGAQNLAEGQLNTLGANVLFVVPGNNDSRRRGIDFPKTLVLAKDSTFRRHHTNHFKALIANADALSDRGARGQKFLLEVRSNDHDIAGPFHVPLVDEAAPGHFKSPHR